MSVSQRNKLFTDLSLTGGSEIDSLVIPLRSIEGEFSLQIEVSGKGGLTVEYCLSNSDFETGSYAFPSGSEAVFKDFRATSGRKQDGKDLQGFQVELASFMRLRFIESTAQRDIVFSATLIYQ